MAIHRSLECPIFGELHVTNNGVMTKKYSWLNPWVSCMVPFLQVLSPVYQSQHQNNVSVELYLFRKYIGARQHWSQIIQIWVNILTQESDILLYVH